MFTESSYFQTAVYISKKSNLCIGKETGKVEIQPHYCFTTYKDKNTTAEYTTLPLATRDTRYCPKSVPSTYRIAAYVLNQSYYFTHIFLSFFKVGVLGTFPTKFCIRSMSTLSAACTNHS
jgi:hypothetical protein